MFKKTKVRSILELLGKGLSARDVSKCLKVSGNTVSEVQALYLESGRSWDDIKDWDDDRLYELFYPDKFKYKPRYAPVDYSYVHAELHKTGVTLQLLWEEYRAKCEKENALACCYVTFVNNYRKYTTGRNYEKTFQKCNGSRKTIFETEEKPYLRKLPLIPYAVCEWSYKHKVGNNSHIW